MLRYPALLFLATQGNCCVYPAQAGRTDHCFLQFGPLHFSLPPNAISFKRSLHKCVPFSCILKKMTRARSYCSPLDPLQLVHIAVALSLISLQHIAIVQRSRFFQTIIKVAATLGNHLLSSQRFKFLKPDLSTLLVTLRTHNSHLPRNFFCQFISLKRSSDFMKKSLILLPCSSLSVV